MPLAFHLLAKPTGAACNLACEYCFYLSKALLYPGSRLRMTEEVLESYIQQLLAAHRTPEVCVAWQGGEPTLMGLDFFKRSVELAKKYRRPGQQVTYTLQTNGTRLDEAWCAFFKKNNFLIGLSIDGPSEMHDAYRVDKGGLGSFDPVRRGWELLQKHKVDTNILCALHAANASHPVEVYRFFRDELQGRFIQFIPVVEQFTPPPAPPRIAESAIQGGQIRPSPDGGYSRPLGGARVSERSVRPEQYGSFLIGVFEEWVRQDVGRVFVQIFDSALASWSGLPANVCIFQEQCGLSLALEHNGDLYSCDHFVEPEFRLGNILETPLSELAASSRQRQFGLDKRERLPAYCRACEVCFACHGECPRNRFLRPPGEALPGNEEGGVNYLCAGYKMFFRHIDQPMRRMAALLRQGRAPAEIMQELARNAHSAR